MIKLFSTSKNKSLQQKHENTLSKTLNDVNCDKYLTSVRDLRNKFVTIL